MRYAGRYSINMDAFNGFHMSRFDRWSMDDDDVQREIRPVVRNLLADFDDVAAEERMPAVLNSYANILTQRLHSETVSSDSDSEERASKRRRC